MTRTLNQNPYNIRRSNGLRRNKYLQIRRKLCRTAYSWSFPFDYILGRTVLWRMAVRSSEQGLFNVWSFVIVIVRFSRVKFSIFHFHIRRATSD